MAELVREAFKRSGYNLKIAYYPWARVVKMAKDGAVDGYFPEYYSDELKEDFFVSSPIPGGPLGFFKKKGKSISYSTLNDLRPYSIGVVRGYINTAEFDAADYLKKDEANDDLQNFKKLLAGRVDLIVADKYVGLYTMATYLPDKAGEVEFISPPLEAKDLYLCISKKSNQASALIQAFEAGYQSMIKDGTTTAIIEKAGLGK